MFVQLASGFGCNPSLQVCSLLLLHKGRVAGSNKLALRCHTGGRVQFETSSAPLNLTFPIARLCESRQALHTYPEGAACLTSKFAVLSG